MACVGCASPSADRTLWRFSTFNRHFWHGWCDATEPLIDGDRLYVGGGYSWWDRKTALWALNRHTGAVLWTSPAPEGFAGSGVSQSLTLADDILVVATSGGLGAFRVADGTRVWFKPNLWGFHAVGGDTVFGVTQSRLLAFGLRSGNERWTRVLEEPLESAPIVLGGHVYLGARRRAALVAIDAASGRDAASIDGLVGFNGLIGTAGGRIFGQAARDDHPVTYLMDPTAGTVIRRDALLMSLQDEVAWFATPDDALEAVDAASGRVIRTWPRLPNASDGVLVDRDVFYQQELRTGEDGLVHAYDLASGSRLWSFHTGDWVQGMALTPEALYLASEDCGVYAVRPGR